MWELLQNLDFSVKCGNYYKFLIRCGRDRSKNTAMQHALNFYFFK
ncbi:hypothetical protein LEP1GSC186_1753 [Leptospira noguchii serovar Autumnalis str. ZUN142]|uniref:Uncharacterized protein n=2 Tax=Leptospira noguchii TaxID=28182 RepID=M6UF23_9LEPT|nr:hypothetical protein LEP1GSC035_3807 [Leptospira noguchii str. 2007001578]EMO41416.1 hypothetical protein LEP1GSC186_1753 [Leptospira noguchii serovar Autumnalis str. ZUN142]